MYTCPYYENLFGIPKKFIQALLQGEKRTNYGSTGKIRVYYMLKTLCTEPKT